MPKVTAVASLVDGYMSAQEQDALQAWRGGVMTWRELRQHTKAAIKLMPKVK